MTVKVLIIRMLWVILQSKNNSNYLNKTNMTTGEIINLLILIVALAALVISLYELHSYKQKENNKLLSQLNKRYLKNTDMQAVVKYLRDIDPEGDEPSAYQVELFLRFFEELYVYLRHDGLKTSDVKEFFNYYLDRLYHSERGKKLLLKINNEDTKLKYLNGYKEIIGFDKQ